jgi:cytochrome c-type biogenesis protein CcmE
MTRKQRRLNLIGLAGIVLASAVGLVLYAMSDGITFFTSPSDVLSHPPGPDRRVRLGGLVEQGSVAKGQNGEVRFAVTDGKSAVPARFVGILPDLFREGQGVVAEGRVDEAGIFQADTVLAKHDETYMPKEVVDALKKSGEWRPATGAGPEPQTVQR